jgi:zinc transport system ATP-binding protein
MAERPPDLLLAAERLSLARGRRVVLDAIDLGVHAGEIVTIIGPNGAGKTTLLKALLGLVPIAAGSVYRRPGLRVGYLPQRLVVDGVLPMTVARFMTLGRPRPAPAVAAALAETGVDHLAGSAVQGLSGGEWQRVLLARTLTGDPDLLVLDEPVQGVDFASEAALYELITAIRRRRGTAVVMVSHDLHLVMAATDRVICLNQHVCCAGTAETVARHPEYVHLFGSRAAGVLGVYRHRHDHAHALSGEIVALAAADEHDDAPAEREAKAGAAASHRDG